MSVEKSSIIIRNTKPKDFAGITKLCLAVYPKAIPWGDKALTSQYKFFPQGQIVAVKGKSEEVLGMAASLVINWDDYDLTETWKDFTDNGMFTNHDPKHGKTLYGAEVMVHPQWQGHGVGKKLYAARRQLAQNLKLLRIRAGARLRNYHQYAKKMSAKEYVIKVVHEEIGDPTLTFQLHQGFHVIAVVPGYLPNDPESLGYAAVIEWLNPDLARKEDWEKVPRIFGKL